MIRVPQFLYRSYLEQPFLSPSGWLLNHSSTTEELAPRNFYIWRQSLWVGNLGMQWVSVVRFFEGIAGGVGTQHPSTQHPSHMFAQMDGTLGMSRLFWEPTQTLKFVVFFCQTRGYERRRALQLVDAEVVLCRALSTVTSISSLDKGSQSQERGITVCRRGGPGALRGVFTMMMKRPKKF